MTLQGTEQTRRNVLKVSGSLLGGVFAGSTVVAAEADGRFIVDKRGGTSVRKLERQGLDVVRDLDEVDLAVVEGAESDLKQVTTDFEVDVTVELADPDVNSEAPNVEDASAVDEPGYPIQWDKQALDVETAHDTTKGEGTRVAVLDTGVAADHPDLEVNMNLSRDFTGDGNGAGIPGGGYHGTHVGGIIAAQTDNDRGVAGTAPETDLVDCRVFSVTGGASFGDILAAIVYSAAIDADVANLSLGAYPIPRQGIGQFYGKVLNRIMTYANKEGTLLVIAAGNDGADLQHDKNFISLPNEGAQAMSVAATGPIGFGWGDAGLEDPPESPAFYTNYGTNAIDIAAPGGDADLEAAADGIPGWYFDLVFNTIAIPQFDDNGNYLGAAHTYSWLAGTSMAAPNVAGAAALVKSANPNYNANQLESALKRAADVPEGYDKAYYGGGFLNILDAL